MTAHSPSAPAANPPGAAKRPNIVVRGARQLYLFGNILLAVGVIVQVFWAGAGALAGPANWAAHRSFAHIIEFLAMGLLLIGGVGLVRARIYGLSWLMYGLFTLQYVFLYAVPRLDLPILLRSLHAVNALAIFWLALLISRQAWRWLRGAA
ncbi:MAG TPA: DUF6220 domain-containing protein [Herpetosiphonaceae bacterium]